MLGLAYVLHTERLHDQKFLDAYTVGFNKFLPYLLGGFRQDPKTPEWAEKITTVPAAEIFANSRDVWSKAAQ